MFEEKVLVCQESDPREIAIGESYGFRVIRLPENVGIQDGIKTCFESSSNEQVLFLENDLQLRGDPKSAIRILSEASIHIQTGTCHFAKFRYLPERRAQKSKAFDTYWQIRGNRIVRRLLGYMRRSKANWELSTSIRLMHDIDALPDGFSKISDDFILSTTKFNKWENLGLLTTRSFIKNLIEFAEENPTKRSINGKPDLEHPLNCRQNRDWLMSQQFRVIISTPGLFGHRRYDRAEEDEKWSMVDPHDEGGDVEIS